MLGHAWRRAAIAGHDALAHPSVTMRRLPRCLLPVDAWAEAGSTARILALDDENPRQRAPRIVGGRASLSTRGSALSFRRRCPRAGRRPCARGFLGVMA